MESLMLNYLNRFKFQARGIKSLLQAFVNRFKELEGVQGIQPPFLGVIAPVNDTLATVTVEMTNDKADLTYTAKEAGNNGNLISVEHIDPAEADVPLSVSVEGNAITITLETDGSSDVVSTAAEVKALIEDTPAANALVTVDVDDTGEGVVEATAKAFLEGGALCSPEAIVGSIGIKAGASELYLRVSTSSWKKISLSSLS
jgi:hypothetical protein